MPRTFPIKLKAIKRSIKPIKGMKPEMGMLFLGRLRGENNYCVVEVAYVNYVKGDVAFWMHNNWNTEMHPGFPGYGWEEHFDYVGMTRLYVEKGEDQPAWCKDPGYWNEPPY